MLVPNATFAIDDIGLWYALNAPFDPHLIFTVKANPRIRITQFGQPIDRSLALILPIDAVDRHLPNLGELHPKWMFGPAGDTPRREDVHDRDLTFQIN